ncbi:MAG TPA: dihydroxyacetone kinase subunit DhaK [Cyanothece sp. UBA12306]|nr:dihydroxyacetone kinase subunit DhaK [Cyanothece sp. UBA12306]
MKKLINTPETLIHETLEGIALAHQELLKVNFDPNFIYRLDAPINNKVALISGGGSGHEPLHSGFVGQGMLDAACPGEIFTSPTPDQMLEAAKTVHGGAGVLNIVKNYSGDVMNFEMALELAIGEGILVSNVIIDDDIAVKDSLYTQGRRGVGTTVIAEKICGAAAEVGYNLKQIEALCHQVNLNGRSMGMALTSCTTPAKGTPTFELNAQEIEMGIGIHGEPGREKMNLKTADEITEMLAISIIEDQKYNRRVRQWNMELEDWTEIELIDPPFNPGDSILVLVNGLGGSPLSELYIVYRKLAQVCQKKGLKIVRNLVGNYITSLEMQGVSITIVKMNDELIKLWDFPVKTPSLRWGI